MFAAVRNSSLVPPESARPVVQAVGNTLVRALGPELLGLFLYGSAVSGGFDEDISDVDLIADTRSPADELDLHRLGPAFDAVISDLPDWAERIEVVSIGVMTLRRFRSAKDAIAVISPGEPLHLTGPARDWLQNFYLARQTAMSIVGPQPDRLLPRVSKREFIDGVRGYVRYLADAVVADDGPGQLAYAVLSACRAASTIERGQPCSKQEGAAWTRDRRPEWAAIIDEALRTRLAHGHAGFEDDAARDAARQLVRDIAEAMNAPNGLGAANGNRWRRGREEAIRVSRRRR